MKYCPPHGIGSVTHDIPVNLSTGDHYSTPAKYNVLILFHHSSELAQSDPSVACVLVFELCGREVIRAERSESIGGTFGSSDIGMQDAIQFHVNSSQSSLHCLQIYFSSWRVQPVQRIYLCLKF